MSGAPGWSLARLSGLLVRRLGSRSGCHGFSPLRKDTLKGGFDKFPTQGFHQRPVAGREFRQVQFMNDEVACGYVEMAGQAAKNTLRGGPLSVFEQGKVTGANSQLESQLLLGEHSGGAEMLYNIANLHGYSAPITTGGPFFEKPASDPLN
ncbi:MAG TPA: hypothetical protein VI455_03505 [Terriglobia bacterium]